MRTQRRIDVVIIEDNKLFKLALKSHLEFAFIDRKIKVHIFGAGENSQERIKRDLTEIVILDYHLDSEIDGAADGIAVLDTIKKESPSTNVIMLTSETDMDIIVKSFQHGAYDYIIKNEFQFDKLKLSMGRIIDNIEKTDIEVKRKKKRDLLLMILIVLLSLQFIYHLFVGL